MEAIALILSLLFVIMSLFVMIIVIIRKKKQDKEDMRFLQSLLLDLRPTLGIEKNLNVMLEKIQHLVEASNYSFYIYNPTNRNYVLKAVRQLTSDAKIAPSYSGLLTYEKERFDPPLSLPRKSLPDRTTVVFEGEVPLISIPIKGEKGLIRIGPTKDLSRKKAKKFDIIGEQLEVSLQNLLETEEHARNYEVLETSVKAVKYIVNKAPDSVRTTYVDLLKSLADSVDGVSPQTVGYSKLMSRYSMVIAKEMGLPEFRVQSIGLAAYLSNIGVLGLSDGLLNIKGKYSDMEYEQMKLHAEIGAAIIENTIAQQEIADYIRYHHERIDGNGYPSQLSGDNIPVGARIISVVQTFLAKINGRSYRTSLPYEKAMQLLHESSNTQLDSEIVGVFIGWYEQKRKSAGPSNRALSNCWDLCCTPSSICSKCPAFGVRDRNCWEVEKNNCQAHGKSCETCFVYTETMSRLANTKG